MCTVGPISYSLWSHVIATFPSVQADSIFGFINLIPTFALQCRKVNRVWVAPEKKKRNCEIPLSFFPCLRFASLRSFIFLCLFRAVLSTGDTSSPRLTCKPTPPRRQRKARTDTKEPTHPTGVASAAATTAVAAAVAADPAAPLELT